MFNKNKEINRKIKQMENQNKANEQLNELTNASNCIDSMLKDFYKDASVALSNNDQDSFELIASSIFYFQDMKKIIQTIRIHFQNYIKTAQFMGTLENIGPTLKSVAKTMNNSQISLKSNDFTKLKKSLLRGKLNMEAMRQMMSSLNPATQSMRSKEELDALKERLLLEKASDNSHIEQSLNQVNQNFFEQINDHIDKE